MPQMIVTEGGIQAAVAAAAGNTAVELTHVEVGAGKYDAAPDRTALLAPIANTKVPLNAAVLDASQASLNAAWTDDAQAWSAYEVGVWAGAVLYAVGSVGTGQDPPPLAQKVAATDLNWQFDLWLGNAPPASVTVAPAVAYTLENTLDFAQTANADTSLALAIARLQARIASLEEAQRPESHIGEVFASASLTTPYGCLLADGRAVSRVTYADLFRAIGVQFGKGDGVATFNIPDMKGNVLVGAGGTSDTLLGNAPGDSGGERAHVLTEDELAGHTHIATVANNGTHRHTMNRYNNAIGSGNIYGPLRGTQLAGGINTADAGDHAHGVLNANTGGDEAHNNMQPSLVMRFYVRYR